eukprot:scaffold55942_cov19-Tisochrysis_lutea.AAC.1
MLLVQPVLALGNTASAASAASARFGQLRLWLASSPSAHCTLSLNFSRKKLALLLRLVLGTLLPGVYGVFGT